jgi:aminocarboxymuconate-semialdehyde decarboxylase|tara:strand:+ start:1003 stop:1998 length:996 start_codon:yes stop_codon:yes gene_type:complete
LGFIDVHTHITSEAYTSLLTEHGSHIYNLRPDSEGRTVVMRGNIRFMTFTEPMFDPEMRFAPMDEVGVDMQLLSYTCPNIYWAGPDIVEHLTRTMNDHLASVCKQWPDRYRGLASVPLQNVELAISEMERAVDDLDMVGLIILANVNEKPLDSPEFEPFWAALNERKLPVLLHPTVPPGIDSMGMDQYGLVPSIGFMIDTTLAVSRMVFAGVFERYPDWPMIVSHAGATIPYIAARLDQCYRNIPDAREHIDRPPTEYLKNLYYDTVTYDDQALQLAINLAGPERVLYGSDYPHNIGDMQGCADRVDSLSIAESDRELIRSGNARRIFRLQ